METLAYLEVNTLVYDPDACINCGMCSIVCPHGAFEAGPTSARLAHKERCMECGACMVNCPARAIYVDSGVGCATAMIYAALRGQKEATCGGDSGCGGASCCG
jgi:NAD-dependent dihydropyrimidine dehydrogenase PreA subunit